MGIWTFIFGNPPEKKVEDKCKAKETFNAIEDKLRMATVSYRQYQYSRPKILKTPPSFESDGDYKKYCLLKIEVDNQRRQADKYKELTGSMFQELYNLIPVEKTWFKVIISGRSFGISKRFSETRPYVAESNHVQYLERKYGLCILPWEDISDSEHLELVYARDQRSSFHDNYYIDDTNFEKICNIIEG